MTSESWGLTPSQTVGPYLAIGLTWADGPYVVPEGTPGSFWISGTVSDGAGEPIPDALVETWQADPDGRFDHPDDPRGRVASTLDGFRGFGRCATDRDGRYRILTVTPGPVPALDDGADEESAGSLQAPHIDVTVLGRGLLDRVVTRIYFPDELLNATDPVLTSVPEPRRHTVIAVPDGDGFRFDIRLQGDGETVFFLI